MTCRGSRFNPTLTTPGQNSPEWEAQNIRSTRNFIRKWGHFCKHDTLMKPIIPPKYNIAFVVKNCNSYLLEALEPWCDRIYIEDDMQVLTTHYIDKEQSNTAFDLTKRVFCIGYNDPNAENDIVIEIDRNRFSEQDFQYIQMMSEIIQSSGEVGDFKLENLKVTINHLETYEKDLIICEMQ
jgi:hypothetical protein